jgi:hypothetical protein
MFDADRIDADLAPEPKRDPHAPFGVDFDPHAIPYGHLDPSSEIVRTILAQREREQ